MLSIPNSRNAARGRYGFTIIELLVVIVIIGILSVISFLVYSGIRQRAVSAAVQAEDSQLDTQLALYNAEYGDYPTEQEFNPDGGCDEEGEFCFTGEYPIRYGCDDTDPNGDCYIQIWPPDNVCDGLLTSTSGESLDVCPPVSSCPDNFIIVPGSATYGTAGFCVMKYEAKNVDGKAVSKPDQKPWLNVNQTLAASISEAACTGCHLITEAEWMTIAENVIEIDDNWISSEVGEGFFSRGVYSGLEPLSANSKFFGGITNNKRILTLSNGEEIWDLAGNAYEWTQGKINADRLPGLATDQPSMFYAGDDIGTNDKEWNNPNLILDGLPVKSFPQIVKNKGWTSSQGIGKLTSNYSTTDTTLEGYIRGGGYLEYQKTGIFALSFKYSDSPKAPSNLYESVGFRVAK